MTTPLEMVLQKYKLPPRIKEVHPLQVEVINSLTPLHNSGAWMEMATGKTLVATIKGLHLRMTQGRTTIVVMPPHLITQWGIWLRSLTPSPAVVEYRGTPKKREALNLDCDFLLMGVQIFKKDYQRISTFFSSHPYSLVIDEATIVANNESEQHRTLYEFSIGVPVMPMSGTPMNKVMDTYGLIKFSAPGTYRNRRHFENMHVEERDFFDNPCAYMQLEILADNLLKNSARVLYSDMYPDAETPLIVPIEYDLEPAHYKLYCQLAEDELLKLPDGSKIDATNANALRHALGQLVLNWGHFAADPKLVAAGIELAEEKLQELGSGKLVIFCNYRLTVALLREKLAAYGAVTYNGDVSAKQKDANFDRFKNDPSCRVIIIQFVAGGSGLDGMQGVCHHAMFLEPCLQPRDFWQCIFRINRPGQRFKPVIMLPTALGTTQVRGFRTLVANDTLVNQVVRNKNDLRDMVYGR